MSNVNITKEEFMAVFPKVADTMADALGCDLEKVKLESSLINDLGAESIDFLDIIFRLERAFKVKIPRGKIVEEARGELSKPSSNKAAWFQRRACAVEDVPERSSGRIVSNRH